MTASQLFRQTESLKKAVSEASFGSNDGWVSRQKLEDLYQRLLVADLEYALDKKVEQDLWNYVFKNQITVMQQQAKDKHSGKADVQAGLNLFLETASGFYLQLLEELCTVFKLDLPFRKRSAFYGIIKEVVNTKNMKTPTKASRLYICQYCLVHLGDIARYRQQTDQAQTYYRHAVYLVPYNGQPYNQLAILEASKGHKLASVFYYVRSLLVRNPFPVAAMNLDKFYNKIIKEPLELKGKLSMNEIVMAFLQFHGLVYLLQDLNKAERLKDRLLTSLPAHITSMSFSSHQFLQIIVINLGAMYQANRNKENKAEFHQQRAHQMVMHLNVSLLESLVSGTPKQRVRDYHTLAALKVLCDWMRHSEGVMEDSTLAESTVWPGMCKLLNNLQYIAQQKNVKLSNSELEKTPLPEDYDVQCFQPLDGCYRMLDFSSPHPDSVSTETETRLRCERLVQHGVWLADQLNTKLHATKQKNGTYVFSTPDSVHNSVQNKPSAPSSVNKQNQNKPALVSQPVPVKIMLSSEEEYPSLGEKRGRQNVAIQSLLSKQTSTSVEKQPVSQPITPVPGSVFILPSQRASQRSPESPAVQSHSAPQLHPPSQSLTPSQSQSQSPVQSSSVPDLKPTSGGILKMPSQDFDQQGVNNGNQKPSVHFRIDAQSNGGSPDRDSPQELLSQPGILKLPSRQIWMPDQPTPVGEKRTNPRVTQGWTQNRMDSPSFQATRSPSNERLQNEGMVAMPGALSAARQLSPTQQAIARQLTPQGVARQSPPQQQQQPPVARQLSPQQLAMQMTSQQVMTSQVMAQQQQQQIRPRQMAPPAGNMATQPMNRPPFPGQLQQQQQQQQIRQHLQQMQHQQQMQQSQQQPPRPPMQLPQQPPRPPMQQDMSLAQQMAMIRPPLPGNTDRPPLPGNNPFFLGNQQDARPPGGAVYRPQQGTKHPLEGLGIQDWPRDNRQFTSYASNNVPPNQAWERMMTGDPRVRPPNPNEPRFKFNVDPFAEQRMRNPLELGALRYANQDPRITLTTQGTSLVSGIQIPRMDGQEKSGFMGPEHHMGPPPTPGGAPPTPGGPGGAPGGYSLFSQAPWPPSGQYDVMHQNVSPQKPTTAAAQSKGASMYQPLWTSGPSPLEKLLEQQKQQRQHEPH